MIQADTQSSGNASTKELKGWHVLVMMLGFFGVMFSVNGVFLYHAVTSFPGEDVKKSYVQGLNYNETLAQRARQAEMGWQAEAGLRDADIVFRLRDRANRPLTGQSVIGEIRRAATQDQDVSIAFAPGPDGEYYAPASVLSAGQWQLRVMVLDANAETVLFEVEKTLIVS